MWILASPAPSAWASRPPPACSGKLGVPVHDADAAVHALYRAEGVAPVEAAFPGVSVDGAIDRPQLSARVLNDSAAMKRLEAIVHPLVRAREEAFLAQARAGGARLVVLDIPLLLETGRGGQWTRWRW